MTTCSNARSRTKSLLIALLALLVISATAGAKDKESFRVVFHYPVGADGNYGTNAGAYAIDVLNPKGLPTTKILALRGSAKTTFTPPDGTIYAIANFGAGDDIVVSVFDVPPTEKQRIRIRVFFSPGYSDNSSDLLYDSELNIEIFPFDSEAITQLRVFAGFSGPPLIGQTPRDPDPGASTQNETAPTPELFTEIEKIVVPSVIEHRPWSLLPIPDGSAVFENDKITLKAFHAMSHTLSTPLPVEWKQLEGPPLVDAPPCAEPACEIPSPKPGGYVFKLSLKNEHGTNSRSFAVNVPGLGESGVMTPIGGIPMGYAPSFDSYSAPRISRRFVVEPSAPFLWLLVARDSVDPIDAAFTAAYDFKEFKLINVRKSQINGNLLYVLGTRLSWFSLKDKRSAYGVSRLLVFDVEDNENPVYLGGMDFGGAPADFIVDGDHLYAFMEYGDAGVEVYNVSNPSRIFKVAAFDKPGMSPGAALDGRALYLNAGELGWKILDVGLFTAPKTLASGKGRFQLLFQLKGKKYMVLTRPPAPNKTQPLFELIDVTAPSAPKPVSAFLSTFGAPAAEELNKARFVLNGSVVYVSRQAPDGKGTLLEGVSIDNPAAPAGRLHYKSSNLIPLFFPFGRSVFLFEGAATNALLPGGSLNDGPH